MTDDSEGDFVRSRGAESPLCTATRPSLGRSWSSASSNSRAACKNAGEILEMRRQQLEILLERREKEIGLKENKPTSPWINLSPAVSLDLSTSPSQSRSQGKEDTSGHGTCKDGKVPASGHGFTFPTKQLMTHNKPVPSLPNTKLNTAPVALPLVAPPVGTPLAVEPIRDSRVRFVVDILPARHNATPPTKLTPVLQADVEQRRAERAFRRSQADSSDILSLAPLSSHGPIDRLSSSSPNTSDSATALVASAESVLTIYQCPLLEACKDFCWYHTN